MTLVSAVDYFNLRYSSFNFTVLVSSVCAYRLCQTTRKSLLQRLICLRRYYPPPHLRGADDPIRPALPTLASSPTVLLLLPRPLSCSTYPSMHTGSAHAVPTDPRTRLPFDLAIHSGILYPLPRWCYGLRRCGGAGLTYASAFRCAGLCNVVA